MNTITLSTPVIGVIDLMDIISKAAIEIAKKAGITITVKQVADFKNGKANFDRLKELAMVGGLVREIASKAAGIDIDVKTIQS